MLTAGAGAGAGLFSGLGVVGWFLRLVKVGKGIVGSRDGGKVR